MLDTVVVTGATGYFGRYFVEHLSERYQVVAMGRNIDKLRMLFPASVEKVVCDLNDPEQTRKMIKELLHQHHVVGLVNNAYHLGKASGFNTPEGALDKHRLDMFHVAFNCGLLSAFVMCQEFGNHCLAEGRGGSIVNISSMYASVAPDPSLYQGKDTFNPISYGMTKAALEYMTKYIASFWGKKGIRCNAIAPGPFPNVETVSENATRDDEFLQRLINKTCSSRVGHPKDLLGMLSLLLGEQGQFINGQIMAVDGGWNVR